MTEQYTTGYPDRSVGALEVKNDTGKGVIERLTFERGIYVDIIKNQMFQDSDIGTGNGGAEPSMQFSTFLEGCCKVYIEGNGWSTLNAGETAYFRLPKSTHRADYKIQAGTRIEYVGYAFQLGTITSFLGEDLPKGWYQYIDAADVNGIYDVVTPSLSTLQITHQISNCPFSGSIRDIYIEGLTLQALAGHAAQYQIPTVTSFNSVDKKKIVLAREFLLHDMRRPPSLNEMAKEVGIGPRKLSKGFKELYGEGAFSVLKNYRLEQARLALLDGAASIKEISWQVGYSNPNNFSSAYKERFGTPPSLEGQASSA